MEEYDMNDAKTSFSVAWNDFYENVAAEVEGNMCSYSKFNENLTEKWRNFSNVVGTTISDYAKDDQEGAQELYNLWKNYQIKMNARIQRAQETEAARYKEILEIWRANGKKLAFPVRTDSQEEGIDEPLYSAWMEITTAMTKQINNVIAESNNEYKELTKTWFEFLDKMKEGVSALNPANPMSGEVTANVRDMCTAMSYEVSNYITMSSKSAVNFQKNWMNMLTSTRNMFSKLFPELNYEELYSGFFDRSAWGASGAFVPTTKVKKLETEVKELSAKLKELEERLEKAP
ncbi:MAG: hypothetical protein HZB92_04035 [Euryarchaeota archaeon]|nr:hypothetical protein [Euryarchaeota archaeon]